MKRTTTAIIALVGILLAGSHHVRASQQEPSENTIVPGVRVGDYTIGMSKDEVLKRLGEPKGISWEGERYTLNNLPRWYFMHFGDISFEIVDDSVKVIIVYSLYKFANGLGVGDSEEKIKQAFGNNFHLKEGGKDFLTYEDEGLTFEIHKKDRTVMEINVSQATGDHDDSREALTPSRLERFDSVCGKDLRTCDLRNAGAILDTLEFNQETLWPTPDRLPEGFDPKALLQEGMNPGLGVRALHAEGITGAGVHVGLIDQPLLMDHPEYAGKIVSYHDTGCGPHKSSMHGPAMASQLVGNQCGTAPGAKLHVVAVPSWKGDAGYYARALDRLVMRNREVRKDQKIRVVSVSTQPSGQGSKYINQSLWDQAVQRAQANCILVLDCTWHHGFVSLCWLDPQDRESVEACTPGFRNGIVEVDEGHIHVPSAPRTVAEASDERPYGYAYDGGGRRSSRPMAKNGYSDTIPYTAGILAMGWQIRPDLTPAQMKEMLFASAYVHKSGARIINPTAFIELIQNQSGSQKIRTRPQTDSEIQTIVPGVGIGDYTLDMSKDDVLKELGEPESIQLGEDDVDVVRRGEERYSLKNLPREHILSFGNISFWFSDDSLEAISVRSPLYKLSNGLGVGDSEQKIKQAFGEDFHLEEVLGKDFLFYLAKGLGFEIHKKNQTVAEIVVYHTEGDSGDSDAPDQQEHSKHTIVPSVGVGNYMLGMSKQVLNKLGQPEGMYFVINDDVVREITVRSPLYKFTNGLGVGDSEDKIKQAFGNDFQLEEFELKALLTYEDKGLQFEIHKQNRTVREITVVRSHVDSDTPDSRKVIMLSEQPPGPITFPKIDRNPKPEEWEGGEMKSLPKYDPNSDSSWQVDLRCYDLSKLDLSNSINDLLYATFRWPGFCGSLE
ncbi:MAG TPA: S8 family serine peptidase [Sedimentisphaerales bacterium]|nr:S8 family serine peptidase [Sedimentisphaerales bacterium]